MDWIWLLLFAGLMFVMHRSGMGCCGGHSHGGHEGHQHGPEKESPPEKTAGPEKPAVLPAASPGGGAAAMSCCGGHAHGHAEAPAEAGRPGDKGSLPAVAVGSEAKRNGNSPEAEMGS